MIYRGYDIVPAAGGGFYVMKGGETFERVYQSEEEAMNTIDQWLKNIRNEDNVGRS